MNSQFFRLQLDSENFSNYSCLAIDLPGHGESDEIIDYSIPELLKILGVELNKLDKFVLVGHSLGGQLAIQLLKLFPHNCLGILIFGTPPINKNIDLTQVYNINETSILLLKETLEDNERCNLSHFLYSHQDSWSSLIGTALKNTDAKFRTGYANSLNNQEYLDELELLQDFKGEKLIVLGAKDPLLRRKYLEEVSEKLNITLKIIDEAGHFPHLEEPAVFNNLLSNFLKSIKL